MLPAGLKMSPICFATLLGQDPKDLPGESSVQGRMKMVVSKMKHVLTIVLDFPLPRIDVDGFRWVSLSFRADSVGKA
jgi:hypothetical protein